MTTKNLSRTVIEGGRYKQNQWARRSSHRYVRAETTALLGRARGGAESLLWPLLEPVPRAFDDKLAPARRFLERRVGQNWDKVYSELCQKFDTRTTAGRHIVFGHMMEWLALGAHKRLPLFEIDGQGRLKRAPRRPYPRLYRPPEPLPEPRAVLDEWVGTRAVAPIGGRLYWFEATVRHGYRQAKALSARESERYSALPLWCRNDLLPAARREAWLKAQSGRVQGLPGWASNAS